MAEYLQIITTTETKAEAERLARVLIEGGLAACAQIVGPITSTYSWKGRIETAEEWQCLIKTRADLFGQVERSIKSVHSYETPEIIALPIRMGSREYLDWMAGLLSPET
ncbi:MAG: divalent-cation tolerance protein CutA [Syntrophales bacterium]|jgi:periplasmic divalent cation tolerance protein|nr:divalent-cation tolerance protein CutA [Syntrophales bacterium]MCK9392053.1 divalent-cation tolerance protein CutA [Syntrophales bacterium]